MKGFVRPCKSSVLQSSVMGIPTSTSGNNIFKKFTWCGKERALTYTLPKHSGNVIQRQIMTAKSMDPVTRAHGQEWDGKVRRGEASNPVYLETKWGCPKGFDGNRKDWRKACLFKRPFNRSYLPIPWWKLDESRRKCIDGVHDDCRYDESLII